MKRDETTERRAADKAAIDQERDSLLENLDAFLDKPLIALGIVWLVLLVVELTRGLGPAMVGLTYAIWGLFVLDFALELVIAPKKTAYLRRNWPTALSLLLPPLRFLRALQALRALRAARAVRSISLLKVLTSANRGMRTVRATVGHYGVGYVVAMTAVATFAGAAGMYFFESPASLEASGLADVAQADGGLRSYAEAVWWTAMTMTTMGADYFPKTAEGRVLGWLLAVYAFAIFGYITATIASFLVGKKPSP